MSNETTLKRHAILIAEFIAPQDPKEREALADTIRKKFSPNAMYCSRSFKDDHWRYSNTEYMYHHKLVCVFKKTGMTKSLYNAIRREAKTAKTVEGYID